MRKEITNPETTSHTDGRIVSQMLADEIFLALGSCREVRVGSKFHDYFTITIYTSTPAAFVEEIYSAVKKIIPRWRRVEITTQPGLFSLIAYAHDMISSDDSLLPVTSFEAIPLPPAPKGVAALATLWQKSRSVAELAVGYTRYEAVRRMSPRQFQDVFERNIKGEGSFDSLVDKTI